MNKKKDLLKGRTKEWDTNDWQGRTERQVKGSEMASFWAFVGMVIVLIGVLVYDMISNY